MKLIKNKRAVSMLVILILSLVVIVSLVFVYNKYFRSAGDNFDATLRCEDNPVIEGVCATSPPAGFNSKPSSEDGEAGCSEGESCYRKFG
jgi:hypothetical protein